MELGKKQINFPVGFREFKQLYNLRMIPKQGLQIKEYV
jgi:hypothetical protein